MFKLFKQDNLGLGVILGFLAPAIAFVIYYLLVSYPNHESFTEYVLRFAHNKGLIPKVAALCLLANGVIFYFYTQTRKDITAKGIFLVTMLMAVAILVLKLIF
ncbi:MAG TPA: hypothetical protein VGC22_11175 [Chitinophaga sp.]